MTEQQKPPTKAQLRSLCFIEQHRREHSCAPTLREIAAGLGLQSTNGVHQQIVAMKRRGLITSKLHSPRTLVITVYGRTFLPELGKTGAPVYAGSASRDAEQVTVTIGLPPNVASIINRMIAVNILADGHVIESVADAVLYMLDQHSKCYEFGVKPKGQKHAEYATEAESGQWEYHQILHAKGITAGRCEIDLSMAGGLWFFIFTRIPRGSPNRNEHGPYASKGAALKKASAMMMLTVEQAWWTP